MLGTVISADMDIIGQLMPNKKVKFVEVNMNQALTARKDRNTALNKLKTALT